MTNFADIPDVPTQRSVLPDGEAGVDTTVAKMVEMAKGNFGTKSAKVRELSIRILAAAKVANKDYWGMTQAIHNWVRDNIRYVRDPVGQETLSYPEYTLSTKGADCDDMVILEMAMLGSIGLSSYPVVIGTTPGLFSHVYLKAIMPPGKHRRAGEHIPLDPIMREWPAGKEAPADKVKIKKEYPNLAGLAMLGNLGAYSTGPDYLEREDSDAQVKFAREGLDIKDGLINNSTKIDSENTQVDRLFNGNYALSSAPDTRTGALGPMTNTTPAGKPMQSRRPLALSPRVQKLRQTPVRQVQEHSNGVPVNTTPPPTAEAIRANDKAEIKGLGRMLASLGYLTTINGPAGSPDTAVAAAWYAKIKAQEAATRLAAAQRELRQAQAASSIAPSARTNQAIVRAKNKIAILTQEAQDALKVAKQGQQVATLAAQTRPGQQRAVNGLAMLDRMQACAGIGQEISQQNAAPGADLRDEATVHRLLADKVTAIQKLLQDALSQLDDIKNRKAKAAYDATKGNLVGRPEAIMTPVPVLSRTTPGTPSNGAGPTLATSADDLIGPAPANA